jgi:hypothetical protein
VCPGSLRSNLTLRSSGFTEESMEIIPPSRVSIREWHKRFMETRGLWRQEVYGECLTENWDMTPHWVPPHRRLAVSEFLNEMLPTFWIGRDGPNLWPSR